MEKELGEIKVVLTEIQKDIHYHIKRTDTLEDMVKPAYRMALFIKIGGSVLIVTAAVAALFIK